MDANQFVATIEARRPETESLLEYGLDPDEVEDVRRTFEFKCLLETVVSADPLVDLLARYDVRRAELRGFEFVPIDRATVATVGTSETVVGRFEADRVVRTVDGRVWLEDHAKSEVRSIVAQSGAMFLAALAIPYQPPCNDLLRACEELAGTTGAPFWIMYVGGS